MPKHSIIFVEDDEILAASLEDQIEDLGYQLKGSADNAYDGLAVILRHKPDILLLDIGLPDGKNGIQLAEEVRKHYSPLIFFLTSQTETEFVREASQVGASSYLVKPVSSDGLKAAIELALAGSTQQNSSDTLTLEYAGRKDLVRFDSILHIKTDGNRYCLFITSDKKYRLRCMLNEALQKLPQEEFIQVHKSHIIRKDAVKSIIARENILLENGDKVPIGKSYRAFVSHNLG